MTSTIPAEAVVDHQHRAEAVSAHIPADLRLPPASSVQLAAKRSIDFVVALVGTIVLLPLGVVLAALVKATSRGPVFFRQERVGKDGVPFKVLKFRSMVNGADRQVKENAAIYAEYVANDFKMAANDPRITKVGRVLRATSLDELPQLLNVLVGHMSLVGIRPLVSPELAVRSEYHQECYRAMRPGVTGLWQVEGRSKIAHDDRRRLDRRYVETWSLWQDIKILAKTPLAVLKVHHSK